MALALIRTLQKVFAENGTKVILASACPKTVNVLI